MAERSRWLVRIPDVFEAHTPEILHRLNFDKVTHLGHGYHSVHAASDASFLQNETALFLRWRLPIEHSWPCRPKEMDGFIEKAAQALLKKFHARRPQLLLVGALDPADRYFRTLASNLRGRALQLFGKFDIRPDEAESQDPEKESLYCLIGPQGLIAGMTRPRLANGFYPGGTRFIRQSGSDSISRAGAKIAEALHYLALYQSPPAAASHWLELGASPGGMTSELLKRDYQITALDRAPLDERLYREPKLRFLLQNVDDYLPPQSPTFDAILSDMNGNPLDALKQVLRLSSALKPHGLIIFTLKTQGIEGLDAILRLHQDAIQRLKVAGMTLIARTHLTYNRQEFTLFARK